MGKGIVSSMSPEQIDQRVERLKAALVSEDAVPSSLLRDLTDQVDDETIASAATDVRKGIPINERYPALWKLLQRDETFRQEFLFTVRDDDPAWEVPRFSPPSLGFLKTTPSPARRLRDAAGAFWDKTVAELELKLFPLKPEHRLLVPARRKGGVIGRGWQTLFKESIDLDSAALDLRVQMMQVDDESADMKLQLLITSSEGARVESWQIKLDWGEYHAEVVANAPGYYELPPLPLAEVVDLDEQLVTAALRFEVERVG